MDRLGVGGRLHSGPQCPVCSKRFPTSDNLALNRHVDLCLRPEPAAAVERKACPVRARRRSVAAVADTRPWRR